MKIFISVLNPHYGTSRRQGKARARAFFPFVLTTLLTALLSACTGKHAPSGAATNTIRIMLDRPPVTLNPRMTLDASGQRLGELIFGALTRKDNQMRPRPDFAESWKILDHGRTWVFKIRSGLQDQSGSPITAHSLARCLEEYRGGKPRSFLAAAFPDWKSVEARGNRVLFHLNRPDPYLATNVTLLRYFTTGDPSKPCQEPRPGQKIIASGDYRPSRFDFVDLTPELGLELIPVKNPAAPKLAFSWSIDDNTKALKLIRGDVDVLSNALSLTKTRWIRKNYPERFRVIERPGGVNVSYLAFNFKNPALRKLAVRKAIALAIDRQSFIRYKMQGFGTPATSLLSPALEESFAPPTLPYDPGKAEELLDQAGYPRGPDGVRLRLHFKTTPVRDGYETVLAIQNMLEKVGIHITVDMVEPAVFFASIRKHAFELYTSRWIGVSDGSIFQRTLRTGALDNRGSYSNPEMDALLDQAKDEIDPVRRKRLLARIQAKIMEDLPILPLWYWNVAVIQRNTLTGLSPDLLSLSGSLEPLTLLRYEGPSL